MKSKTSSTISHTYNKKKSFAKSIKPKGPENLKIIKCKFCLNPQSKTTFNFSCKHQLCGICISHLLIREDFKSLSEKEKIKLECSICKSNQADNIGIIQTSLDEIVKLLDETFPIRTEKKKDICIVHNKLAENYCIQCKKWICIDCKNIFHNTHFKDHELVLEEPFEYKNCKKHTDTIMDLFCSDCNKQVCHFCSRKGEDHEGHKIITLNEFRLNILKSKKNYKYKNFDEFQQFLTECEKEFKKNYENSFKIKQEIANDILKLIEDFNTEFFSKKKEKENFIDNYFKIIKGCYFNYFHDLKIKDPIINNLNFINSINKEILSINFESDYTEELEKIREDIKSVNPKKFFKYEMKFLHHSLYCIKTIKEEKENHIYCITQLKNGNIVTGGDKGILNVWDLETLQKIDWFQAHEGNVYSVIQLTDGRLVSASSDLWIKFWDFDHVTEPEPKKFDIIDQKKLEEYNIKKNKIKIKKQENEIKGDENNIIIIRPKNGEIKNDINNINTDAPKNETTILNNNNINNTNINQNTNYANNNNTNTFNSNFNQTQFNNVAVPGNNLNSNDKLKSNKGPINSGLSNPPDVSYSKGGIVKELPKDVPFGDSGQSSPQNVGINITNNLNNLNNNNTGMMDKSVNENQINNNINNINNNTNTLSSINNNTNVMQSNVMQSQNIDNKSSINESKEKDEDISRSKNLENDFDFPDESNTNVKKSDSPKRVTKIKESNMISESIREDNFPANPPKNPSNSESDNKDPAYSSNNGKITINENGKEAVIETKGNRCLIALRGHYDDVFCLLETSKRQLVSGSKDGSILIWSIDNHNTIYNFKAHNNSVGCAIEIGENKIVTGGADCKIKIWDLSSNPEGEEDILSGHTNAVFSICKINEQLIASASCDKTIRLWDVVKKECLNIFSGHKGYVWSVVKLKEENKIASSSSDKTIKIWNIDELKCINTINAHKHDITALALLSDGKLASASTDMQIKIWEC